MITKFRNGLYGLHNHNLKSAALVGDLNISYNLK